MTNAPTQARPVIRARWLASYPKSGNTWVRFLIYQYFRGEARSSGEIARLIPGFHHPAQMRAAEPFQGSLFAKTHFPLGPNIPHTDRAIGCIYVVRHPRDVILSCLDYARLLGRVSDAQGVTDESYIHAFLERGGAPEYFPFGFGTLDNHYRSWLDQTAIPTLLLRYEDLKSEPARQLTRVVEFLGHAPDPARIDRAVALSSFQRLQAMEIQEKNAGAPGAIFVGSTDQMKKGRLFMNKGESGRSLEPIAPGLDRAVDDRFADMIRRFGY
jgi:hypothetical protein